MSESTTPKPKTPLKKKKDTFFTALHGPVFWPSIIIILIMIVGTIMLGDTAAGWFNTARVNITDWGSWLFVFGVNAFIVFSLYFAFSKFGKIRLGGEKAKPDFSTSAWFAMLFSAGMGIGLMFFAVAEPMWHLLYPPHAEVGSIDSVRDAMGVTFLHWGLHAWAIYAVVGLSLAFFAFNRKLPLSFRSVFYPLLGDRINGWIGDVIDILAVLATLFGLATSLGLGAAQAGAGMEFVFGFENTTTLQVIIIVVVTLVALVSVLLGVQKGVKVLSEFNIRLAGLFLLAILIFGPTLFILGTFIQSTGYYFQNFLEYATWVEAFDEDGSFMPTWTVFYWAWWISWSPYVGMFIARISRGRTIREFVLGVLIVPTMVTFLWMSGFGGTAIFLETTGIADIAAAVEADQTTSLFILLQQFPLAIVTSILAIILVLSFFVTSSDSGSLVIDGLTTGGNIDSPASLRAFWASAEGLVAAILLIGGGLGALQAASITTGLPFVILLLVMCYSLNKGLSAEYKENMARDRDKEREDYRTLVARLLKEQREKKTS
ncbi:MAG: BCCT family transporter [Candidatus Cyclonatronum sp.]|uniref:BCCT family transporter n=1 Tax=Cyclonatronum sp. TaxID=3024185 RepID=UPI0025C1847A|nr:BCCT family transporter [Cyclonatronum sp.]MCC5934003.1 BCCT family transporter [Balneolales bacterium]MCH8486693.1 BCCT family transporter [Cyclonatronum sp.]